MGYKLDRVIEGSHAGLQICDASQGPDIEDEVQMGVIPRPISIVSCYHGSLHITFKT